MSGAGAAGWKTFSDRTYGPGWEATKRRYWSKSWTPKRCVWCYAKQPLDLNHLTYRRVRDHKVYGPGWTPLWTVLPMCRRCHKIETWLTRKVARPLLSKKSDLYAHAYVTVGVWASTRFGPLLVLAAFTRHLL